MNDYQEDFYITDFHYITDMEFEEAKQWINEQIKEGYYLVDDFVNLTKEEIIAFVRLEKERRENE